MPLPQHTDFVDNALAMLQSDQRIVGVAAGGSWITNSMDEFSDIDLVIVVAPDYERDISEERGQIAAGLGNLLACFTGEHVHEPRLLICLYGPPLLHVDLKFVALPDVADRVEDPVILWEREQRLSTAFRNTQSVYPLPDLQWIEDRFWVWVHYTALKIGRGELFEAMETLSFLRVTVLGPLSLMRHGHLPKGMRHIERDAKDHLPLLMKTAPVHDASACLAALRHAVALYQELRSHHKTTEFVARDQAEEQSILYVDHLIRTFERT
jgi:predicted nucleotidyltransferase